MKKYFSRRMLAVFFLGFSSGLPLAVAGSLLAAWFKTSGLSIVAIGCLSLIGQPYTYKFLWAPLLDQFNAPFFKSLDHRRAWIVSAQLLILLIILIMSCLDPKTTPVLLALSGVLLAFSSATQDIVIDAYRVNLLAPEERGLGTALAVEGYRLAIMVSGSFGLILADYAGWRVTYLTMSSLMLVGILTVFLVAPSLPAVKQQQTNFNLKHIIWQPLENFLTKDRAIWLLMLIILYKIGDVCSQALVTPFLIELQFSLTAVGTITKIIGITASLIGIMCAGIVMTKLDLFKSLLIFGCLQGLSNLLYMLLAIIGKNYPIAVIVFFIENLCAGMGNAALSAFLVSLCSKEYSATQYALFSSLTALGRVYMGPVAGVLVASLGWQWFYLCSAGLAIPGILLILFLKQHIVIYDNRKITSYL